ncbi:MAG: UMP kinase [bacterium]
MSQSNGSLKYKRIVLKLSGESLQGDKDYGISHEAARSLARQIAEVDEAGAEITVVIGGGNIFRGLEASEQGMDRASADYMGMLATVMNGLALQDALEKEGVSPRLFSAIEMMEIAETFTRARAIAHLNRGGVNVAVAGTGSPYFSTDTAASLRALEIGAEVILKATKVDGVYDKDPMQHDDATRFDRMSYLDVVNQNLQVMDHTATTLCRENNLPIVVFNMKEEGNILNIVEGEDIGTLIHGGQTSAREPV